MPETGPKLAQRNKGLSIHVMTASGALAGFLALQAAFDGEIRSALVWLVVCQVLDGIDGPIARRYDVTVHVPNIDGRVLDLVVDYVTCVVVPTVLLINLELVPGSLSSPMAAAILISSALWFARVDQETDDAWFRGFPGMWNIVVPSFLILGTSQTAAALICVAGCVLQLSNVEFPHIVRAPAMRKLTVAVTIVYFSAFVALSATYPRSNSALRAVVLVAPVYIGLIVIWRAFFPGRTIFGRSVVGGKTHP